MEKASKLIVLTGKTASGKDTIVKQILNTFPQMIRVVTTTSRTPRPNEIDGIDYHFLSREQFELKKNSGELIEYVEYGGNFYGTEKKEISNSLGKDIIWRIDPSRAAEARSFIKRAFSPETAERLINIVKVIYITTSDEVVLQRLKSRNLSEEEIQKRIADDKKIWESNKGNYDYVVENIPGNLSRAVNKILEIITDR